MPIKANQELQLEAAHALMAHLRRFPEDAGMPAEQLAQQFGLDVQFVRNVLGQIQVPDRSTAHTYRGPSPLQRLGRGLITGIDRSFDWATQKPVVFVAATTLIGLGTIKAVTWLIFPMLLGAMGFEASMWRILLFTSVGSLVCIAHLVCYFRRAMARYALYGALEIWVITSLVFMTLYWLEKSNETEVQKALAVALIAVLTFMGSSVYALFGTMFSVLGGWHRLKQHEYQEEQLSRQELLERYFQLQGRLEEGNSLDLTKEWEQFQLVKLVQAHPVRFLFAWGFGISAAYHVAEAFLSAKGGNPFGDESFLILFLSLGFVIFQCLGFVFGCLMSGSVVRSVVASLAFCVGTGLSVLLPVGDGGVGYFTNLHNLPSILAFTFVFLATGALVGLGATIQQKALRDRSLQGNDQATVMGEMLRIQWRLANASGTVCVMVVDAAKSTEMKMNADPLAVEYSFREYQNWIEELSAKHHGQVHSTAGDGAVVAFPDSAEAFCAAQRLVADLDRFNQEDNRLDRPFRLRIGLHQGEVAGELDKVQFTQVIDVAAHVESICPVGGIALTDVVVAQLPMHQFVPLARTMDGHNVFVAMDPSEAENC